MTPEAGFDAWVGPAAALVRDGDFVVCVGSFARRAANAALTSGKRFRIWARGSVLEVPEESGYRTLADLIRICDVTPTDLASLAMRGRVDMHFLQAHECDAQGCLNGSQQEFGGSRRTIGGLAFADALELVRRPVVLILSELAAEPVRRCTYNFADRLTRDVDATLTVLSPESLYQISANGVRRRALDGAGERSVQIR